MLIRPAPLVHPMHTLLHCTHPPTPMPLACATQRVSACMWRMRPSSKELFLCGTLPCIVWLLSFKLQLAFSLLQLAVNHTADGVECMYGCRCASLGTGTHTRARFVSMTTRSKNPLKQQAGHAGLVPQLLAGHLLLITHAGSPSYPSYPSWQAKLFCRFHS